MSEKIKNLAIKLSGLIKGDVESPSDVYSQLKEIMKKQSSYFTQLNKIDNSLIIKLIFYIFSLKNSKDFKLGENMLNKLFFASFFTTEGDFPVVRCQDCRGDGYIPCNNCGGSGKETCQECNGNGEFYLEDGERIPCNECDGDGEIGCGDCNGNGDNICHMCNGAGDIDDEQKFVYTIYDICCWNTNVKNRCELTINTDEPSFNYENFEDVLKYSLVLDHREENGEFKDNPITDVYYCFGLDDEPTLNIELPLSKINLNNDMEDYYIL